MNVKFQTTVGIIYKVLESNVMEWDEEVGRYEPHHKLEILNLVPVRLLQETDEESNAVEIAVKLNLQRKILQSG